MMYETIPAPVHFNWRRKLVDVAMYYTTSMTLQGLIIIHETAWSYAI